MPNLVDRIRQRYPHPVSAADAKPYPTSQYCVLGAACRFLVRSDFTGFPSNLNAALALGIPHCAAVQIALLNDQDNFDEAWQRLQTALDYRQPIPAIAEEKKPDEDLVLTP